MAVKKTTSRKRSTTKRTTTSRRTTKAAPKRGSPAKPPAAELAPVAESREPRAESQEPSVTAPPAPLRLVPPRPTPQCATAETPNGRRPSRFTGDHYLHAAGPEQVEGGPRRPGKWLIFVSRSRVDALWEAISRGVQQGRLGHAAMVSTALPDPAARPTKKHTIAVYTADENDAVDVRRVRDGLRALGITWRIPYKSETATRAGQNDEMVGGPATKYYE
jgi:hypothetical protein